jgi:hypothetical protein
LAAKPQSSPSITTQSNISLTNASTSELSKGVVTTADHLLGYANFTNENGTTEANSTFKWHKRTEYRKNGTIAYWKMDGNVNGDNLKEGIA